MTLVIFSTLADDHLTVPRGKKSLYFSRSIWDVKAATCDGAISGKSTKNISKLTHSKIH